MTENNDNFIMLPTVDFCFKELMKNPKVRKGFIAALLNLPPEEVEDTVLRPTILEKESKDDKMGILDVGVTMKDGTQIDMEMQVAYFEYWEKRILFYLSKMYSGQIKEGETYDNLKKCVHVSVLNFIHIPDDSRCCHTVNLRDAETGEFYSDLFELKILELPKLPKDLTSRDQLIGGIQFFNGKSREEFEDMAKSDEFLDEAYQTLLKLSADDKKRLEYEAREKALRDYNTQMSSAEKRGLEHGYKRGEKIGLKCGEEIGLKRGEEIGLKRGEEIGLKRGEEIGLKRGEEIGQNRVNALNQLLALQGRTEDMIKAAQNVEYQEILFAEFHL